MARQDKARHAPDIKRRAELRRLRYNAGLTQGQLATRAGIARQTLVSIEGGHSLPQAATAKALADALGVKADDFLADELAA